MIRIASNMIKERFQYVTEHPKLRHEETLNQAFEPWKDWSSLDRDIDNLRRRLEREKELEYFRVGLEWVWHNVTEDIDDWLDILAALTDDQVRGILEHTYKGLYPDHPFPPPKPEDVTVIRMSNEDWEAHKAANPL